MADMASRSSQPAGLTFSMPSRRTSEITTRHTPAESNLGVIHICTYTAMHTYIATECMYVLLVNVYTIMYHASIFIHREGISFQRMQGVQALGTVERFLCSVSVQLEDTLLLVHTLLLTFALATLQYSDQFVPVSGDLLRELAN